MSEYEHIKALRYKPTKKELNSIYTEMKKWGKTTDLYSWIKDKNDWGEYLQRVKYFLLFNRDGNTNFFDIGYGYSYTTDEQHYYLDYVLTDDWDSEGDWQKVRRLTRKEKEKWKSMFEQIFPSVNMNRVRLVEYCWYNGVDPSDVYDDVKDDFYNEV